MATARLVELSFSRRNLKTAGDSVEGTWSRRTFPAIIALHASIILGTLLWGRRVRLPWLALLVATQPVRAWALLSLGWRWNARGAVANDLEVVSTGPYAFVRHPNYAVVMIELAALPAAFRLNRLAGAATLLNALLLSIRISEEEALLFKLPAYREHFAKKPRFLPLLF
jgi:methyltransferase